MNIEISGIRTLVNNPGSVKFNGLSIITGKNSSGKTTYTSAIRMLKKSLENAKFDNLIVDIMDNHYKLDYEDFGTGATKDSLQPSGIKYLEFIFSSSVPTTESFRIKYHYHDDYLIICNISFCIGDDLVFSLELDGENYSPLEDRRIAMGYLIINFETFFQHYSTTISKNIQTIINGEKDNSKKSIFESERKIIDRFLEDLISNYSKIFRDPKEGLENLKGFINNDFVDIRSKIKPGTKTFEDLNKIFKTIGKEGFYDSIDNLEAAPFSAIYKSINKVLKHEDELIKDYFNEFEYNISEPNINEQIKYSSNILFYYQLVFKLINFKLASSFKLLTNLTFLDSSVSNAERYFDISNKSLKTHPEKVNFIKWISNELDPEWGNSFNENFTRDFNKILKQLEIKGKINTRISGEFNLAGIFIKNGKKFTNIAELGYGHYKVINIAIVLHCLKQYYDGGNYHAQNFGGDGGTLEIILTEPEQGLHPDLQSKLCSLLCDFIELKEKDKTRINIIVETHSTIFIDMLRLKIVQNKIKSTDCQIYYFEKDNDDVTKIREIKLTKNGMLTKPLGTGFLDMSSILIDETLKIKFN